MLAMKRLLNRFSYSLVWCNKINCAAIQDHILGGPVRLQLGDIQQEMQEIRGRSKYDAGCPASKHIYQMMCDNEERPMAVISPDGRLGVAQNEFECKMQAVMQGHFCINSQNVC